MRERGGEKQLKQKEREMRRRRKEKKGEYGKVNEAGIDGSKEGHGTRIKNREQQQQIICNFEKRDRERERGHRERERETGVKC